MESIKKLVAGIQKWGCLTICLVMLLAAIAGLFYNEFRYYSKSEALQWAAQNVTEVSSENVNANLEGELIYLEGDVQAQATRSDPVFDVESSGIKMERFVEEYVRRRGDDNTTYKWIDSGVSPSPGSENVNARVFQADNVRIGAYELSDGLVRDDVPVHTFDVREQLETDLPDEIQEQSFIYSAFGGGLCFPEGESSDQCGNDRDNLADVRVYWEQFPEGPTSLYAGLEDGKLVPFESPDFTEPLARVSTGHDSASAMFQAEREENFGGFLGFYILISFGLFMSLVFFLSTMSSIIDGNWPLVGKIESFGLQLLGMILLFLAILGVTRGLGWLLFGVLGL